MRRSYWARNCLPWLVLGGSVVALCTHQPMHCLELVALGMLLMEDKNHVG